MCVVRFNTAPDSIRHDDTGGRSHSGCLRLLCHVEPSGVFDQDAPWKLPERTPMNNLRSGIFLAPFHALDENPILALERDMELLQHLDALNYSEAWIGEHHSGGF